MAKYTLYSYFRSSASYRVRIALALKGLDYEYRAVHLVADGGQQHSDAYRAKNPMSEVPTLEILSEGGDVEGRLAQSVAIIEYLDETHPAPALYPGDALNRALIRQRVEGVNAWIQPAQNLRVMQRVVELTGGGRPEMAAWARHWIDRGLSGLDTLVEATAGTYSVGDTITAADLWLVPQVYNARRFKLDMDDYPTLKRVAEACESLAAFQSAHPSCQPDTPEELRKG